MNVERFEQELPKMLQQARDEEVYPNDQQMLNNYREANDTLKEKFQLLPMHYNWKAYRRLEPSTFFQVKIKGEVSAFTHALELESLLGVGTERLFSDQDSSLAWPKIWKWVASHGQV